MHESFQSPKDQWPLLSSLAHLFPSLSPSHICLLHLSPFPSGQPADTVSLHSTNGAIARVLFFTAYPTCSGKLLLNCASILQMNCLDNPILALAPAVKRFRGRPGRQLTQTHGWMSGNLSLCSVGGRGIITDAAGCCFLWQFYLYLALHATTKVTQFFCCLLKKCLKSSKKLKTNS